MFVMADNSDNDERQKYVQDPRIPCQFGKKCYRKNEMHLKKYKHPPNPNNVGQNRDVPVAKKIKLDLNETQNTSENSDVADKKDTFFDEVNNKLNTKEKEVEEVTDRNIVDDFESKTEDNTSLKQSNNCNESEKIASWENVNKKQFIKDKFLVEMPEDFYSFWDLCKKLNDKNPRLAFKQVGLTLVGPYDVLAESFSCTKQICDEDYLRHWRYYYDPPEFQTVLRGSEKTGFHIGYFRDSPDALPVCMVNNCAEKDGVISICGENIYAAVSIYLDDIKKMGDPFMKSFVPKFQSRIKEDAENLKLNLSARTSKIIERDRKVVAKTFNKVGLVVPYNKRTQLGYRELAMSNKELQTLLTKLKNALPEQREKFLSDLQPVITYASIAADECDFGTNIELGWDILFYGIDHLNSTVARVLLTSYRLLNREVFAKIAEAHLKCRTKGCNLSTL